MGKFREGMGLLGGVPYPNTMTGGVRTLGSL